VGTRADAASNFAGCGGRGVDRAVVATGSWMERSPPPGAGHRSAADQHALRILYVTAGSPVDRAGQAIASAAAMAFLGPFARRLHGKCKFPV
jgi:hypothetical protein